jgi:hypothetical protein
MPLKATLEIPQETGRDGAIDHIARMQNGGKSQGPGRLLHSGEKGDWYLVKDAGGVCVIHIPNLSLGQSPRRMDVVDALQGGPARDELLRLIGGLVDQ